MWCFSLSTIEVEYLKITKAMKQIIWLQGLERTKHIVIRYYFIQDIIFIGIIDVKKVSTHDNPGDIITNVDLTKNFRHYLNMIRVSYINKLFEKLKGRRGDIIPIDG